MRRKLADLDLVPGECSKDKGGVWKVSSECCEEDHEHLRLSYELTRDSGTGTAVFIGLNPAADGVLPAQEGEGATVVKCDATIRNIKSFFEGRENFAQVADGLIDPTSYSRVVITNLFALATPHMDELMAKLGGDGDADRDLYGDVAYEQTKRLLDKYRDAPVICAWGCGALDFSSAAKKDAVVEAAKKVEGLVRSDPDRVCLSFPHRKSRSLRAPYTAPSWCRWNGGRRLENYEWSND